MSQNILSEDALKRALETARIAAYEAGRYLIQQRGNVHVLYKKSSRDNLLDVDLGSETIILRRLHEDFPDFGILSEEAGELNKETNFQWIIDPLDGSTNFQHRNPTFGVTIGLRVKGIIILGVIYLPMWDDTFTVIRGQGALLNDSPIHVSDISSLKEAIVHLGDFTKHSDHGEEEKGTKVFLRLNELVNRIRMIGTAATDFAYVACGQADALVMSGINPWDIDVGSLLVTEAGGAVSVLKDDLGRVTAIYSNKALHAQLVELLSS